MHASFYCPWVFRKIFTPNFHVWLYAETWGSGERVFPLLGQCWGDILGRATKCREEDIAVGAQNQNWRRQNKHESPRIPKGLGWRGSWGGTRQAYQVCIIRGQWPWGTPGLCHLANLGGIHGQPVSPKGNQPWIFIGRIDAQAEAPILWPPDAKSWLNGKDPDTGKDWR